jgi:UDP-N-acetylmuramoylalanine-D-glutamate ligase
VKAVVMQGAYNTEMIDFFSGLGKDFSYVMNLEDAVRTAFHTCERGDAVIYSPGVPCNEVYGSYQKRGEKFQEAIAQL